ncbi:MAG: hypothetical protein ABEJ56_04170 [Candidatus Nanohaloarchaea archaeon]
MHSSEEEIQEVLLNSDVGRKGIKFEKAKEVLNGDIFVLQEDQPEELTEEDIENIDDVEYLVNEFGPIAGAKHFQHHQKDNIEYFRPSSSHNNYENSFLPGNAQAIIHSRDEYDERILEAYAEANDLELGPDSWQGTSFAMLHAIEKDFSNQRNWLRYRDPEGYSTFYENKKYDDRLRSADNPQELMKMIDSSLHFAKGLYRTLNED